MTVKKRNEIQREIVKFEKQRYDSFVCSITRILSKVAHEMTCLEIRSITCEAFCRKKATRNGVPFYPNVKQLQLQSHSYLTMFQRCLEVLQRNYKSHPNELKTDDDGVATNNELCQLKLFSRAPLPSTSFFTYYFPFGNENS